MKFVVFILLLHLVASVFSVETKIFHLYRDGEKKTGFADVPTPESGRTLLQNIRNLAIQLFGDKDLEWIWSLDGEQITVDSQITKDEYVMTRWGDVFMYPTISEGFEFEKKLEGYTVKGKTLSLKPKIFGLPKFISSAEADYLSHIILKKGKYDPSASKSKVLFEEGLPYLWSDPIMKRIFDRVLNFTTALSHLEEPEIYIYSEGSDLEIIDPSTKDSSHRKKIGVINLFLTNNGAPIVFPHTNSKYTNSSPIHFVNEMCDGKESAVKVTPRKGNAVLHYTMIESGQTKAEMDEKAVEAICPVQNGKRIMISFGFNNFPTKLVDVTRKRKVYHPYKPDETKSSSFMEISVGDIIYVIDDIGEHWWEGILRGKRGFFPKAYTIDYVTEADYMQREDAPKQTDANELTVEDFASGGKAEVKEKQDLKDEL